MAKSANLGAAKNAKQDEFYTQLSDIEKEMRHYRRHFKDKTILCNSMIRSSRTSSSFSCSISIVSALKKSLPPVTRVLQLLGSSCLYSMFLVIPLKQETSLIKQL